MASSAEREVRDALVEWWHKHEPRGRVVHELPLSSFSGEGRADLGIIFPDTIVLVEIKSELDKLTRLQKQFDAMASRAHAWHMVCHEKWFDADGQPKDQEWVHYSHREHFWRYPAPSDGWRFERYRITATPHPAHMLGMLWADELREAGAARGLTMIGSISDLYRKLSGRQVAQAVCGALRRRSFAEADPPIFDETPMSGAA